FDIRKELDVLATRKAMRLMTPAQFKQMRALLEETDRLNDAGRVPEVMAKFTEFNNFIYDASHMLRLKMIVNQLQNYLIYFRDISINGDDRRNLAIQEHWLIYRGMLNRDDDQIKLITREHLGHSLQYILKVMKAKNIE
ncbi:FCD domain-containing protein, partial [Lacticaseibacillus paracasei]